jgi:hypothetical protein
MQNGAIKLQKIRAQPIGISAAPNSAGQARGEGGKDGRSATSKRGADLCSFCDSFHLRGLSFARDRAIDGVATEAKKAPHE